MKRKIFIAIVSIFTMLLLLASCASPASMYEAAAASAAPADAEYSAEAPEPAPAESAETGKGAGLGDLSDAQLPQTDRKLVYTASFSINSRNFDSDYNTIKTQLSEINGYVETENTHTDNPEYGYTRSADMTLRVPQPSFNTFLDKLSGIGELREKSISTEDISSQYFDTDARIEILEQRKARLMNYLETATTTEDIIKLESELSDVLYELDQYKGSKRGMDKMVEYTAVNVNLREIVTPDKVAGTPERPLDQRTQDAFQISWAGVGSFLQNFAIAISAAAPVLLLLAIIAAGVFGVIKLIKYLKTKSRKAPPLQ